MHTSSTSEEVQPLTLKTDFVAMTTVVITDSKDTNALEQTPNGATTKAVCASTTQFKLSSTDSTTCKEPSTRTSMHAPVCILSTRDSTFELIHAQDISSAFTQHV